MKIAIKEGDKIYYPEPVDDVMVRPKKTPEYKADGLKVAVKEADGTITECYDRPEGASFDAPNPMPGLKVEVSEPKPIEVTRTPWDEVAPPPDIPENEPEDMSVPVPEIDPPTHLASADEEKDNDTPAEDEKEDEDNEQEGEEYTSGGNPSGEDETGGLEHESANAGDGDAAEQTDPETAADDSVKVQDQEDVQPAENLEGVNETKPLRDEKGRFISTKSGGSKKNTKTKGPKMKSTFIPAE